MLLAEKIKNMSKLIFKNVSTSLKREMFLTAYNADRNSSYTDTHVCGSVLTAIASETEGGADKYTHPRFDITISSSYYSEGSLKQIFEEYL